MAPPTPAGVDAVDAASDNDDAREIPIPGGLFGAPGVQVEDADEEIMELYMNLDAGSEAGSGGLGFLSASEREMQLSLELVPPDRGWRGKKAPKREAVSVEVTVVQDPGALRARAGETGSVLWRSSLHLARHLLQEHYFPPPAPLLRLADARVLELGAGTGVLASLLGPVAKSYTASDRTENVRLVGKNIAANGGAVRGPGRAVVCSLDWVDVSAARARAAKSQKVYAAPEADADVVLAVDCIYNESLVGPLVDTLTACCARGAVAWVVVELRSADVLTTFLDTWLHDSAGWTIVRLADDAMGRWEGGRARWVGWVGWCRARAE